MEYSSEVMFSSGRGEQYTLVTALLQQHATLEDPEGATPTVALLVLMADDLVL